MGCLQRGYEHLILFFLLVFHFCQVEDQTELFSMLSENTYVCRHLSVLVKSTWWLEAPLLGSQAEKDGVFYPEEEKAP